MRIYSAISTRISLRITLEDYLQFLPVFLMEHLQEVFLGFLLTLLQELLLSFVPALCFKDFKDFFANFQQEFPPFLSENFRENFSTDSSWISMEISAETFP